MILIRNRVATVFCALLAAVGSPFLLGQDRDRDVVRPLLQPQRTAVLITHVWSGEPRRSTRLAIRSWKRPESAGLSPVPNCAARSPEP